MLKWLFRKRLARAEALEEYLGHFETGELAYLKNLALMGFLPNPLPSDGLSKHDRILLCAHIQTEWLVSNGEIKADPVERGASRARYNIGLAKVVAGLSGGSASKSLAALSPHRLIEPDLDSAQEDRLGAHLIVVERMFADPTGCATLPELNDIGEGVAWLPKARG